MKRNIMRRLCRATLPVLTIGAFLLSSHVNAQPNLSITYPVQASSNPEIAFAISSHPEVINMDIMDDTYVNPLSNNSVTAIVWDELKAGIWVCSLYVFDEATGSAFYQEIATDAKHPDVALLDVAVHQPTSPGQGQPGSFMAVVVYENIISGKIELNYVDMNNMMGHGSPVTVGSIHSIQVLDAGWGDGEYPHIDAIPDDLNNTSHWGAGASLPNFVGIGDYVVTWTENNSGSRRIYADDGATNAADLPAISNNPQYIGDGELADVAGVRHQNNNIFVSDKLAHIIYKNGTDLYYSEYNITQATVSPPTLWDATSTYGVTSIGMPRIDAFNMEQAPGAHVLRWQAAAELDFSGTKYVHFYDNTGTTGTGIETTCPIDPSCLNSSHEGKIPSVSAGPGTNYNAFLSYGYHNVQVAYLSDEGVPGGDYDFWGLTHDAGHTNLWTAVEINNGALSTGINQVFATSVSVNAGITHGAAWNVDIAASGPEIHWKFSNTATNILVYKPGRPASVANTTTNEKLVYPNPANDILNIDNAAGTSYTITDVTGRIITSGVVSDNHQLISIINFANGIYLLNMSKDGVSENMKFVKQ